MNGQKEDTYILGGVSEEDVLEGERQTQNGELVPLEELRRELQKEINKEIDQAAIRLESILNELRQLHSSWDSYAQSIINKVKGVEHDRQECDMD